MTPKNIPKCGLPPDFCDLIMGALSQRAGRLTPAFLHTGFESGLLASLPISECSVGMAEHDESSSVQIIMCRVDCCLMTNPPAYMSTLALIHDAELLLTVLSFSYLCSLVFLTCNKFSSLSFLICSLTAHAPHLRPNAAQDPKHTWRQSHRRHCKLRSAQHCDSSVSRSPPG